MKLKAPFHSSFLPRIWNTEEKTLLVRETMDNNVRSVTFNSDGSALAAGMSDGSFTVLKTK